MNEEQELPLKTCAPVTLFAKNITLGKYYP